ncbi:hypothetical protein Syun_029581 [Stephania yunnanensis]|uniref:Uncharacterized protein n=1 Tax=Stephania yunnanensis TaxID=152371 RepID=A0AAP0E976_9MAGN
MRKKTVVYDEDISTNTYESYYKKNRWLAKGYQPIKILCEDQEKWARLEDLEMSTTIDASTYLSNEACTPSFWSIIEDRIKNYFDVKLIKLIRKIKKSWSYIINECFYPTKQHFKMKIPIVALLYHLVIKKGYIDVRKIIHDSMKFAMQMTKNEGLPFPILIIELHRKVGVGFDTKFDVLPDRTINDVGVQRMKKVVGFDDSEDEGEAFNAIIAREARK